MEHEVVGLEGLNGVERHEPENLSDKDEGEVSDVVLGEFSFGGDLLSRFTHGFATDDIVMEFFSEFVLFDGEE